MNVLRTLAMGLAIQLSAATLGCSAGDGGVGIGSITAGNGAGTGGASSASGGGGARASSGGGVGTGGGSSISVSGSGVGGGGGDNVNADAACVASAMQGEQRPVALFFMMDNSGSMDTVDRPQTQSRWQLISTAVPAFLADPANVGVYVGLDFFPELLAPDAGMNGGNNGNNNNNATCNVLDYEKPNVPLAALPGPNNSQVDAMATAINTRVVQGQTPTTPALQGAIYSATQWQIAHPEMSTFVVFMTDGQPNGCNANVANAAAAAAAGVAAMPSIKTFVLGVGPQTGNLDAIAAGGGTGPTAYLVTTGGAAELTAALNAIKGTAVSCDYKVPTPTNGATIDFNAVNVQTRVGTTGTKGILMNVPSAANCGSGDGWYYDQPVGGSTPPTTITLCPSTCSALTSNNGSQLQVLIGCKTVTTVR